MLVKCLRYIMWLKDFTITRVTTLYYNNAIIDYIRILQGKYVGFFGLKASKIRCKIILGPTTPQGLLATFYYFKAYVLANCYKDIQNCL